jgi:hypothetical protein
LLLLTLSACGGGNNTVRIYDNAHVLNTSRVQNAASNLPNPLAIYTTSTFQGTETDFQRTAIQKLNGNPDQIVMAIDTTSRYIYIARGSNVPLSGGGINQAVSAFAGNFNNGDYTGASIAAINSLQNSLGASGGSRGGPAFSPLIPCLLIPLLLILGGIFFAASRRGRMRGMMGRGGQWQQPQSPMPGGGPYYDPNQGYGPYNQGYPPNQRGGMNPWAAGGLGAAAGGLAGYELGKMAGERDEERRDMGGNDFGAGGGGFFGGNDPNSGNFGNSGDQGGGGFFGGNDPNSGFGSGGDQGGGGFFGGGGGDDFGAGNFDNGGGNSGGGGNF